MWVSFWFTAQDPCQRQPQQVPPRAARVGFRPHLGLSTIGLIAPLVETLRFEPLRSVQFSTPSKCQGFQQLLCPVYWLPCLPASLGCGLGWGYRICGLTGAQSPHCFGPPQPFLAPSCFLQTSSLLRLQPPPSFPPSRAPSCLSLLPASQSILGEWGQVSWTGNRN